MSQGHDKRKEGKVIEHRVAQEVAPRVASSPNTSGTVEKFEKRVERGSGKRPKKARITNRQEEEVKNTLNPLKHKKRPKTGTI